MKETYRKSSGLLELVVVGLIIAVLFVIAVPAILERISTSKKNAYIDIVKMYVDAARMAVITERIDVSSNVDNATFISFEQLKPYMESGDFTSSYGNEWVSEHSFVVVVNESSINNQTKFTYYVSAWDGEHAIGCTIGDESMAEIVLETDLTAENVVVTTDGAVALPEAKYTKKVSVNGYTYLTLDPEGVIQMFAFDE